MTKRIAPALFMAAALSGGVALAQVGSGGINQPQSSPANTPGGLNSPNGASPNGSLDQSGALIANPSKASLADRDFLKAASQGGMFEIKAGQLASEKGNSPDVKHFGEMMVSDHTKLNADMKPVLAQAGVKPPSEISKKDQKVYAKLEGLSGDAFDQAYIKAMLKDHEGDKKDFENEAQNGQLATEKQAAQHGVTVIDKHLQAIKEVAQAHNVPAKGE